ncbi:MAG: SpoIIE family protein phosphatase [Candidatus Solibacter usitatus]|nr:SpoIIE family protein phosphatase [Candidatus Solibacter usitatus]
MLRFLLVFAAACSLPGQVETSIHADLSGAWRMSADDNPRYAQPGVDDSAWRTVQLPRGDDRLPRGVYWLRRTVHIPPGSTGSNVVLALGSVCEIYEVYINGTRIGDSGNAGGLRMRLAWPRLFTLPALAPGPLTIALRLDRTQEGMAVIRGHMGDLGPYQLSNSSSAASALDSAARNRRVRIHSALILLPIEAILCVVLFTFWRTDRARKEFLWLALYEGVSVSLNIFHFARGTVPTLETGSMLAYMHFFGISYSLTLVMFVRFALEVPRRERILALRVSCLALAAGIVYLFAQPEMLIPLWRPLIAFADVLALLWSLSALLRGTAPQWPVAVAIVIQTVLEINTTMGGGVISPMFATGDIRWLTSRVATVTLALLISTQLLRRAVLDRQERNRLAGEMAGARAVQQMLLADGERPESGYSVDAVYIPAQEVGGDFYRAFDNEDGSLSLVCGDVSGKGLKAAMTVSLILGVLQNRRSNQPGEVLRELNRALTGRLDGGFVTCCCARFGMDGQVTVANAGHVAPYRGGGEMELESGLPAGIVADVTYRESSVFLESGESMTFVSDGVVEAANLKGELFGFDRTREISPQSAQQIAQAAQAWGQNDDITVVKVEHTHTAGI